jgi:hypothetical protein
MSKVFADNVLPGKKSRSRIVSFHLGVVFELNNHEQKSSHRVQDAEYNRSVNGEKSRCMKFRLVV